MNLRVTSTRTWVVRVTAVTVAVAVPLLTLPAVPRISLWPVLVGMVPWVLGKYVLCPLRWHSLSEAGQSRRWHLRAYAESEVMGLLTPGHVGADIWRARRLTRVGLATPSAVAEVGIDRLVGALGLSVFVAIAGAAMPTRMLLTALLVAALAIVAALTVRRIRPELMPDRRLPSARHVARGMVLSMGYQLTIGALLYSTVAATGHTVSPVALLGVFGASQVAGAVPGPNGASPRDGALVAALITLDVPLRAAIGAVALMATLAWLPALALGGGSLLLSRRTRLGQTRLGPALAG